MRHEQQFLKSEIWVPRRSSFLVEWHVSFLLEMSFVVFGAKISQKYYMNYEYISEMAQFVVDYYGLDTHN